MLKIGDKVRVEYDGEIEKIEVSKDSITYHLRFMKPGKDKYNGYGYAVVDEEIVEPVGTEAGNGQK